MATSTNQSGAPDAGNRWQAPIPPAVRRQAEKAEQIAREQREAAQEPQEGQEQQPAPQEPQGQEPTPQPQEARQELSQEQQPAPEQRDVAPQPDVDPNADSWKHRFESEQGRTNKLRGDVDKLSTEISNLRRLLATVQTAPPPQREPDPEPSPIADVSAEEVEKWGPDLLEVMEKKARKIAAEMTREATRDLREQLQQVTGRVDNVNQAAAADAFTRMQSTLDSDSAIGVNGANWRQLNNDEEFNQWLRMPDPLSGTKRHDMLLAAWNVNDASRVAAFFKSFLREANRVAPAPSAAPVANGTAKQPAGDPLASLAAPGRARASAPTNGAERGKPIITTGDITRFYADAAAGRFKGREAERDAYEKEVFAATNEGRVREGPPSRV